jgi:hypothetical protein
LLAASLNLYLYEYNLTELKTHGHAEQNTLLVNGKCVFVAFDKLG